MKTYVVLQFHLLRTRAGAVEGHGDGFVLISRSVQMRMMHNTG